MEPITRLMTVNEMFFHQPITVNKIAKQLSATEADIAISPATLPEPVPVTSSMDLTKPFCGTVSIWQQIGNHLSKNWIYYAIGIGGLILLIKLNKMAEEENKNSH